MKTNAKQTTVPSKKYILTLLAAGIALLAFQTQASGSSIAGSGVELNVNGTLTLYSLDGSSGTQLVPLGSSATLSSAWANGTEFAPVLNLGSFNPATQTLTLTGGSLLTNHGLFVTVNSAILDFQVFQGSPGGFNQISLPLNENNVSGNPFEQRWATESVPSNLLLGRANGTYTLAVYLQAFATDSGAISNNGGQNYGATFTVVPEPSSLGLLGGASILGASFFLRRRIPWSSIKAAASW